MPLKASPEDQAVLLEVQAVDTRLQQLEHQANTLPELATITKLSAEAEEARLTGVEEGGALEDAQTELTRVESDVRVVEERIARDTGRLEASSSVKEVAGLEAELAALHTRQSDLEDIQLAVMERLDELDARAAATRARHGELRARIAEAEAARDAALETISSEREDALANRAVLVGKLPEDLIALYERQRQRYGFGASLLRGGVSGASGVTLTQSDMAAIRAAAPDDVVLCPDSNAILVRTAESGI